MVGAVVHCVVEGERHGVDKHCGVVEYEFCKARVVEATVVLFNVPVHIHTYILHVCTIGSARKSTNIEDIFPQDSNGPTPAGTM